MKGKEMKKKHAFFSHLTTHLKVVPDSVHLCLIVMKVTNEERNEKHELNTSERNTGTNEPCVFPLPLFNSRAHLSPLVIEQNTKGKHGSLILYS